MSYTISPDEMQYLREYGYDKACHAKVYGREGYEYQVERYDKRYRFAHLIASNGHMQHVHYCANPEPHQLYIHAAHQREDYVHRYCHRRFESNSCHLLQ